MRRRIVLAVLGVLSGVIGVYLNSAQATIHMVSIGDNFFSPQVLNNVNIGDTVRWTNNGALPHTSTSNTGIWNSPTLSNGQSFQRQFNTSGSFPYHCAIHPAMTATVNVLVPNQAPNLVLPGTQNVAVPGQSVSFNVSATDANANDTVNISFTGLNPTPTSTSAIYAGNNPGTLNWTPICVEAGSYYARFQASDGKGAFDNDSVLINVSCVTTYVKMKDLQFVPQVETIGPGEQVCWVHEDTLCDPPLCYHTTTSDSAGLWDSDSMFFNDTFCVIFDSLGDFPYHCIPHLIDGMTGTIVVFTPPCNAKPGDANASNSYSLGDVIQTVNYIFNKPGCSPQPICWLSGLLCRGDWNASSSVTLGDVIQAVNFIFNKPGGPWGAKCVGTCCVPVCL